jgi:hypothetical protein
VREVVGHNGTLRSLRPLENTVDYS